MANKLYEESYIQDIASAIRLKNGTSNTYLVSEMGDAIRAIEGSGSPSMELLLQEKTITENGEYIADDGYDGFSSVVVAVTTSGGNESVNDKFKSLVNRTITEVAADDLGDITIIAGSAFYDCSSLVSVTIPNSVTTIDYSAFRNCTSLSSIIIPSKVAKIANYAFYGCTSLTDMYINATTPPTLGAASALPSTVTIHVPIYSGDTYKSKTNWAAYADQIVADIQL